MTETLKVVTQRDSWLQEVDQNVIETLESMLERARAGELTGVAICATTKDNCTVTSYSKLDRTAMMLGAVTRLQHAIANL